MKKIFFLIVSLFVGYNGICQSIVTDRPTQGVSTSIVPLGQFQIESGTALEIMTNEDFGFTHQSFVFPTLLFRMPVHSAVELRVGNTLRYNRTEDLFFQTNKSWEIDDLQAGFKWRITNLEKSNVQIALMSHVVIPTGSQISSNYGIINKLLVSNSFDNGVGIGYNVGWDYFGAGSGNLTYTFSVGTPLGKNIGIYGEVYGAYNNFETFIINADAGFTYLLNERMQLDYSFGVGLNNRMNYQALGFSILFEK